MKHEELSKTEEYQKLLKEIPEEQRQEVETSLKQFMDEFNEKILGLLATLPKQESP